MPARPAQRLGKRYSTRSIAARYWAYRFLYDKGRCVIARVARGDFPQKSIGLKALSSAETSMPALPNARLDGPGLLPPHASAGRWAKDTPLLAGYLVDSCWPDGEVRKAGRLFITPGNGHWEFCLKEPDNGLLLVATVEDPDEGRTALELLLQLSNVPWRADPWARNVKKKKK